MIDVRVGQQRLNDILAAPPKIDDQINAACRKLTLRVRISKDLKVQLGDAVELWYGGKRWYYGFLKYRKFRSKGEVELISYDPLYFMNRNPGDFYVKNQTATQAIRKLAQDLGIPIGSIANTRAVFKALYYHSAQPDKVAIDLIARTFKDTNKKYWYRFNPDTSGFGLQLFEKKIPSKLWAFQVGVNLESAEYADSIERLATIVKLVDRETGKVVERINTAAYKKYGPLTYFEEVNKDDNKNMDRIARERIEELSKVKADISIRGINPNRSMPQFFSGDVIYVEEKYTNLIGAYHIRNVTQTFHSDNLVSLGMDLQEAPEIPKLQYDRATENPNEKRDHTTKQPNKTKK